MVDRVVEKALQSMEGQFSIVLKELDTGRLLYSGAADRQLPSASTIKILILAEAYNQAAQGVIDLCERIRVKKEDKVEFSIITDMNTDEYTLRDLLVLMMTISDNTATNILIDRLGMEQINRLGTDIGLADTRLCRKMMDFEAARLGRQNVTSPSDMLKLMEKLYRGELVSKEASEEMLDIMEIVVEKDCMVRSLPPDIKVAHKTGELDNLNHDIGIVFTGKKDYILGIFATELRDNIYGRECIARLSKEIFDEMVQV